MLFSLGSCELASTLDGCGSLPASPPDGQRMTVHLTTWANLVPAAAKIAPRIGTFGLGAFGVVTIVRFIDLNL
jgi:hypothetical protein